MTEFSLALDGRTGALGCAGRSARCPNVAQYRATLTYCECIEARNEGMHDPDRCTYRDVNDDVPLCIACAVQVRSWPVLTELADVTPVTP